MTPIRQALLALLTAVLLASPVLAQVDTGAIRPGESKTISFVADSTFSLVPYWPASNRKKSYTVKVTVQP